MECNMRSTRAPSHLARCLVPVQMASLQLNEADILFYGSEVFSDDETIEDLYGGERTNQMWQREQNRESTMRHRLPDDLPKVGSRNLP
jgi:hypothetical protein